MLRNGPARKAPPAAVLVPDASRPACLSDLSGGASPPASPQHALSPQQASGPAPRGGLRTTMNRISTKLRPKSTNSTSTASMTDGASSVSGESSAVTSRLGVLLAGGTTTRMEGYLKEKGKFGWRSRFVSLEEGHVRVAKSSEEEEGSALGGAGTGAGGGGAQQAEVFEVTDIDELVYRRRGLPKFNIYVGARKYKLMAASSHEAETWVQHLLTEAQNQAILMSKLVDLMLREQEEGGEAAVKSDKDRQRARGIEHLMRQRVRMWVLAKGEIHDSVAEALEQLGDFLTSQGRENEGDVHVLRAEIVRDSLEAEALRKERRQPPKVSENQGLIVVRAWLEVLSRAAESGKGEETRRREKEINLYMAQVQAQKRDELRAQAVEAEQRARAAEAELARMRAEGRKKEEAAARAEAAALSATEATAKARYEGAARASLDRGSRASLSLLRPYSTVPATGQAPAAAPAAPAGAVASPPAAAAAATAAGAGAGAGAGARRASHRRSVSAVPSSSIAAELQPRDKSVSAVIAEEGESKKRSSSVNQRFAPPSSPEAPASPRHDAMASAYAAYATAPPAPSLPTAAAAAAAADKDKDNHKDKREPARPSSRSISRSGAEPTSPKALSSLNINDDDFAALSEEELAIVLKAKVAALRQKKMTIQNERSATLRAPVNLSAPAAASDEAQPPAPEPRGACYLVYTEASEGTLYVHWSMEPVHNCIGEFVPEVAVSKHKFSHNGGRQEIIRGFTAQRGMQRYFQGLTMFLKMAFDHKSCQSFLARGPLAPFSIFLWREEIVQSVGVGAHFSLLGAQAIAIIGSNVTSYDGVMKMNLQQFCVIGMQTGFSMQLLAAAVPARKQSQHKIEPSPVIV